MDGLGETPEHVTVVARVTAEGYLLFNHWMDLGYIQRGRWGSFKVVGDWIQFLDGLELHADPAEFRGGGRFKR